MKKFSLIFLLLFFFAPHSAFANSGAVPAQPIPASPAIAAGNKIISIELGFEASHIVYEEPNFMEERGMMYGLAGAITYLEKFMIRNELRVANGEVDYTSNGTGKMDGIQDFLFETRLLGGPVFPINKKSSFIPYIGIGYRYLNDDTGKKRTTTNARGYERESTYFYLPLGAELNAAMQKDFAIRLRAEYDIFLKGKQESHLSDAFAGLGDLKNEQKSGYGARASIRLSKKSADLEFLFEPFLRYWNIDDSEVSLVTYNGVVIGYGLEPQNNSTEIGVKLGVTF